MKRTDRAMALCISLLSLNLLLIWGNSLLNAEISTWISDQVGKLVSLFFPGSGTQSGGTNHGLLRKVAHFAEFCSLGILLSWLSRMLGKQSWMWYVLPLLGGFLAACVDESIQLFVPGRSAGITDVGIDTLGTLLGILLITLITFVKRKCMEEQKL